MRNNEFGSAQGPTQIISVRCAIVKTSIRTNRNKRFKKTEQELEKMCIEKGVKYVHPELNEVDHRTQSRRRNVKDLCGPKEAVKRRTKHAAVMRTQENQKKDAERRRTPENPKKMRHGRVLLLKINRKPRSE